MNDKPTLILGASPNPGRYSYLITLKLHEHGHTVFPLGIKEGRIGDLDILHDCPQDVKIHTVTMYLGQEHQKSWEDLILSLKPERIIFNPGAENKGLYDKATQRGITCIEGCTLVMLASGDF
ncbi:hypothetical protein SDC9_55063 [bioreactor metagenome]|uniref:CoA-binding domain-containing protein n=1 Tax=bioreactor metagenome TaxID=1076179 RepID=A0A644WY70_9ZZZZ